MKALALIMALLLALPAFAVEPVAKVEADSDGGSRVQVGVDLLGKDKTWWQEHPILASLAALLVGAIAVDQTGVADVDGWLKDAFHGGGSDDKKLDVRIERAENVIIIRGDSNQADLDRKDDD